MSKWNGFRAAQHLFLSSSKTINLVSIIKSTLAHESNFEVYVSVFAKQYYTLANAFFPAACDDAGFVH